MCEFTVFVEQNGNRERVAKNVIKAKEKDGKVTLMDASGNNSKVEGATIIVVDTLMQELVLKKLSG